MDDLVKRHPLYAQLSRLDDDMEALQLRSVGPSPALAPADLRRQQLALQKELEAASDRANAALKAKQQEYAKRENDAIREALASAGGGAGPGGAAIGAGIDAQMQRQARDVARKAQANLDAYRKQVVAQDESALRAVQASLNERAARSYRTKLEQLQKKEADEALRLANENSGERLSLRTKLSNLVLDETQRDDARKQLEALDRKENDALAAMKNRDVATLNAYQNQLRAETGAEINRQASAMRARTLAKINKRERDTQTELATKLGLPVGGGTNGAPRTAQLPSDVRTKLEALHEKYKQDFTKDAKATIDDFQKTRAQLTNRFAKLQGVDNASLIAAQTQLTVLQKQRSQLYEQMVAQIGREVKLIAARRGINVVVSDVAGPSNAVDLTADAEKDIESLHE